MRIQSKQSFPQIEKVKNKSKVNSKMRSKVDDKLRSLIQEKRIDVIEEESKKEGKNIILEQLMNLLQNNYGNGKKTKEIMFAV